MRVLLLGAAPLGGRYRIVDSMAEHVVAALRALGATVDYYAYRERYVGPLNVNRIFERLRTDWRWIATTPADRDVLRQIRSGRPDVVMTLTGNYTSPRLAAAIREVTRAPLVCWCQDHMGTMGRQYIIGCNYDYVFAKDAVMVDRLRRYTSCRNVHYLAEACNPAVHTPAGLTDSDLRPHRCDVTTAGSLYYFRAEALAALKDYDLRIWGTLPRHYEGELRAQHRGASIYLRDKAACFRAAKVVVNTLHPLELGGLNARAFEVAGCGGFQLITAGDAVERHFVPGREIETFGDLGELREKVRYYLSHEDERAAIADRAVARAHAEHTYEHRLREMFDLVF